jgi:hypothetical protein
MDEFEVFEVKPFVSRLLGVYFFIFLFLLIIYQGHVIPTKFL